MGPIGDFLDLGVKGDAWGWFFFRSKGQTFSVGFVEKIETERVVEMSNEKNLVD